MVFFFRLCGVFSLNDLYVIGEFWYGALMYTLAHVEGQEETMYRQKIPEAILPGHGDYVQNTSTDDTETTSAYLTAVYQQPVVGEEHGATASLCPVGRNTETTNRREYEEGLCCR